MIAAVAAHHGLIGCAVVVVLMVLTVGGSMLAAFASERRGR
jgi:hypothetical protein